MSTPYSRATNPGLLVALTQMYDTQEIQELNVNSQEFKNFLVTLNQSINDIALALNIKDSAYYVRDEFVNSQLYFPNDPDSRTGPNQAIYRNVFRKVIDFGGLPNAGLKSVAHGLTPTDSWKFTRIYATASDTTAHEYIPIPFTDDTNPNADIEIRVDDTNVIIDTDAFDRTNFNETYVVLEFVKD